MKPKLHPYPIPNSKIVTLTIHWPSAGLLVYYIYALRLELRLRLGLGYWLVSVAGGTGGLFSL